MKEINDLPIYDIWPIIFRNLSINDLFNCRLVSKKFKEFSDNTNGIDKLIIGEPNLFEDKDDCYWYYNDQIIENEDIISLECFRSIKLLSIFNLDKYLKYLRINDRELKLEEISNLNNLEFLEFGSRYVNHKKHTINLNNLKVLASYNQSFKLNTPKLEKIQFYAINQIKLDGNTELIKHLITINYHNKFKIFKNLEIIELRDTQKSTLINIENVLTIFKNLRQLKINLGDWLDNPFKIINYSDEIISNSLIKILNDKMKLRKETDIYLEGVKIENMDKFNELKANKYPYWEFRLNNYDLLDSNLSFINQLVYEEFDEYVNNIKNNLSSSFFDKFQNIRFVYVNDLDDVDGLNWFINNLKCLSILEISVPLDQLFYDNLPNTIRFLLFSGKDINLDFILKLSKLTWLTTWVDEDLFDFAFISFLKLKYLKHFDFYYKKRKVKISKKDKDFYLSYENDSNLDGYEKLDYNQLIVKCNKIRSK